MALSAEARVRLIRSGSRANTQRAQRGSERTHCRTDTRGSTRSVRWIAVSCMRRALQDGQSPLFLHENATSRSCPQEPQCTRAKPCARIPQRR